MKNKMQIGLIIVGMLLLFVMGCTDASVASQNLRQSSDNFEINRRIVFFNGITDQYLLVVEGKCAIFSDRVTNGELEVICKTGHNEYKKHYFGLSDNTAYFVEQIEPAEASAYYYRVIFKPQVIVPDINTRVAAELPDTRIVIE
ncbi:hypothetical protein KY320_01390 [Candidatus Woesearchaeota archaeon]|nr:hypothetical protein [Candidatus Woesearchaeota archaeon]